MHANRGILLSHPIMYGHFGNQPLIAILICIITLIAKKILNFSHQNTKTRDIQQTLTFIAYKTRYIETKKENRHFIKKTNRLSHIFITLENNYLST